MAALPGSSSAISLHREKISVASPRRRCRERGHLRASAVVSCYYLRRRRRESPATAAKSGLRRRPVAAAEDGMVLIQAEEEASQHEKAAAEYDWREEWYPLYLTAEVPIDSPLGLTVFHKQLVLYRDGGGVFRCYEDRCPHRLAKLSEGQLIEGRLECLYHGWQFEGDGQCVKIPQLPAGAKIPHSACTRSYEVRDSQGVIWLPWFEHYARPGFQDVSAIHELPYDHSILLENFMDPAHVPISHDRSDFYSKREDAQPLIFEVTERSARGFAGNWRKSKPTAATNSSGSTPPDGRSTTSPPVPCRPTGQGKSMVIMRFGTTLSSPVMKLLPRWFFHQNMSKVLEQDMGFLSSQNELYLNLSSCDTWVAEYRRWMDRAGHGMPYYFGSRTISLPAEPAVVEQSPAGVAAGISASPPAKGGVGSLHAANPINRYFRHVVHCRACRGALESFRAWGRPCMFLRFCRSQWPSWRKDGSGKSPCSVRLLVLDGGLPLLRRTFSHHDELRPRAPETVI
ncbi:unnamed protein product [Spirodela intermedia]|uniref:Rieske domain-containing protein n=1 Tax=Spirodela intermedia TaxID=51605 RepID=A0A7I8JLR6_SPIIN|nr:unnamed protein product [Spirodela intermedia]CAA6671030.1 unnamed protein product [Spirodela intermedia]